MSIGSRSAISMRRQAWGGWLAVCLLAAGLAAAVRSSSLPPADFTFVNGTEVKSLDPAIVTGQPENRLINALFEGLVRWHPETLEPIPGVAESWEISDDQLRYRFRLRRSARWSDGSPVTADDFVYSFRRFLDPRTAAEYAYQGWYVKHARRYSAGGRGLRPGDRVEVELTRHPDDVNTLRGDVVRGTLARIEDATGAALADERIAAALADDDFSLESWTFVVDVQGQQRRYRYADDSAAQQPAPAGIAWCRQLLLDFEEVGVKRLADDCVEFTLEHPTSYFLQLLGFYPLFPVNRRCVERYGSPAWTYPEHIVCNGPFVPEFRRLRDRTRLAKNEAYWNAAEIALSSIDVLAVESSTTALNLYMTGQADWVYDTPSTALRVLLNEDPPRDDLNPSTFLNTYYYLLNVNRPPLNDVRVRRALSLALDRAEIAERILAAGERPALSLTPPGIPGYDPPQCPPEDPVEARRLLAEAGYPEGRGFPTLSILFNTHEAHRAIAELVRKQWQRNLGITVKGRNEEWASYLSSQRQSNFDVCRKGWIGDYADPNTFLDMFVTGGEQNNTGWGRPEYDALIAAAAREADPARRLQLLADAERMLMDELPLLPVYFYVSKNLVKPYVRGFYNNIQDFHPLWALSIDRTQQSPNPFLRGRR
jgi:oligopeptide transport system substrate-binding protein